MRTEATMLKARLWCFCLAMKGRGNSLGGKVRGQLLFGRNIWAFLKAEERQRLRYKEIDHRMDNSEKRAQKYSMILVLGSNWNPLRGFPISQSTIS